MLAGNIVLGITNVKYTFSSEIGLLDCISKASEEQLILRMQKREVLMRDHPIVVICEARNPVFLYTEGLGPCVAALVFCSLKNGKCLIACAHLTPATGDDLKLSNLVKRIGCVLEYQEYDGEEVQFHKSRKLRHAEETDTRIYEEMRKEIMEAEHILCLLSCRAGITSDGLPLVRKLLDISFDYNPQKYPSYKKVKEHCLLNLNIDPTKMKICDF